MSATRAGPDGVEPDLTECPHHDGESEHRDGRGERGHPEADAHDDQRYHQDPDSGDSIENPQDEDLGHDHHDRVDRVDQPERVRAQAVGLDRQRKGHQALHVHDRAEQCARAEADEKPIGQRLRITCRP